MAGLPSEISEPQTRALVPAPRRKKSRDRSVEVRVSIVSFRRRLLDSDNYVSGCKQLRDAVAEILGYDDAEGSGLEFEYEQVLTRGTEGTLIRVEQL